MHPRHPSHHSWKPHWRHRGNEERDEARSNYPARGFSGEYDEADDCDHEAPARLGRFGNRFTTGFDQSSGEMSGRSRGNYPNEDYGVTRENAGSRAPYESRSSAEDTRRIQSQGQPYYYSNRVRGADATRSSGYGSEDGSRGVARGEESFGAGRGYADPDAGSSGYDRGESWSYGEGGTGRDFGHSGKGPKGYRRSSERIQEEVCELLARHPEIDASDMEVKVEDGSVILEGTVPDRQTKRLAERAIDSIPGVADVVNRLSVR
jgi:osmotically-inducible protein OsmY